MTVNGQPRSADPGNLEGNVALNQQGHFQRQNIMFFWLKLSALQGQLTLNYLDTSQCPDTAVMGYEIQTHLSIGEVPPVKPQPDKPRRANIRTTIKNSNSTVAAAVPLIAYIEGGSGIPFKRSGWFHTWGQLNLQELHDFSILLPQTFTRPYFPREQSLLKALDLFFNIMWCQKW